jgi:hypothetical protein
MFEDSNITQLCHFMMCFLNDVFFCSLMGYLQCLVAFIRTHGFQIGSHNEIQFVFYLMITSLKIKPMVLTWVKSVPIL